MYGKRTNRRENNSCNEARLSQIFCVEIDETFVAYYYALRWFKYCSFSACSCIHCCDSTACTLNLQQNSEYCNMANSLMHDDTQKSIYVKTNKISAAILRLDLGFLRCSVSVLKHPKRYLTTSSLIVVLPDKSLKKY